MKHKFLFLLLIPSWPLQAQVLDQILTCNEMAMGDRKQIGSIQSFKTVSRLEEFGSYVADPFISYFHRDHKIAIEAHINSYGIYREGKTIETRYEDYRKVNGVMVPFSSAEWDYSTTTRLTQTQNREIIFNPNIEKTLFQLE